MNNSDFSEVSQSTIPQKDGFYKNLFNNLFSKLSVLIPCILIISIFITGLFIFKFQDSNLYLEIDFENAYLPPSSKHIFGTNEYGQDMFKLILIGCFTTLSLAFITTFINILIGTIIGVLWVSFPKLDFLILFIKSILDNIPLFMLYIIIISFLGSSFISLVIILTLLGWINTACLIRNNLLLTKNKDYNLVSKIYKTPLLKRAKNNYIPVILPIIFNSVSLSIPEVISYEISLSYFKLSFIKNVSLGNLLYSSISNNHCFSHPYLFIFPFIFLFVINWCFFSINKSISKYSKERS